VIVEHEYEAKESDELTLRLGDVVRDVVKQDGGWWEGVLNGKKGVFPDNFVKVRSVVCQQLLDPRLYERQSIVNIRSTVGRRSLTFAASAIWNYLTLIFHSPFLSSLFS